MGPSLETSLIVIPCNTFHILSSKTMSNTMAKRVNTKNKLSSWMVLVTLTPCQKWRSSKGRRVLRIQCIKKYKMYIVQGANRILRAMLGDHIFGRKWPNVVQCRQYWSKRSKMVGPNWSKKLVSQHCSKKSATFFGNPVDTYKVHKVYTRSAASAQREPVMSPSPPFGHRSLIGSFGSVDSLRL